MKAIQLLCLLFVVGTQCYAQENKVAENTIANQFKNLYKNSNNYQIYKVVKKNDYLVLEKNVLDSIKNLKSTSTKKQTQINTHLKEINKLNDKISLLNSNLSTSIAKEDAINLLGMQLNKTTYNSILWSIIIGLFIGFGFFIFKFKNSNVITQETKKMLQEIENDFEAHKKKSLEKEQKLRRQLQDEINKQRGV